MRCAIYTRKSSDERLDAEYSSLDNQRAYCAAYIASQGGNGWVEVATLYDDGGISGGSLKRPALSRLRADIAAGLVDVVVVYKIDRLSRSLRDFANLISEFDAGNATFASVTQAFDTATSMGRLTLNVLLSFAQFEREMTSERLKDWFAGAADRGLWMAGGRPLGYLVQAGHLTVIPEEAAIVRRIYRRYPRLKSTRALAHELNADGLLNHRRIPFGPQYLTNKLCTRLYLGEIPFRGGFQAGHHEPIVTEREWQAVQRAMDEARRRCRGIQAASLPGLLKGILYGPTGHAMLHHPVKGGSGQVYRYYVSKAIARYGPGTCPAGRFRAAELEAAVMEAVDNLTGKMRHPRRSAEQEQLLRMLVTRIEVGVDDMHIHLRTGGTIRAPVAGRVAETKRTTGWWRAPEVVAAIMAPRPDAQIAAELGIAIGSVSRIRHSLKSA